MLHREKHNWKSERYLDRRGTRHSDPYLVLVLSPINEEKTSPTYDDICMFIEQMLDVEKINDVNLKRYPQLPAKLHKLRKILSKYDGASNNHEYFNPNST